MPQKKHSAAVPLPESQPQSASLPPDGIAVGDCIQLMNTWPAASLDLVFADPPYNIGYQYDHYEDDRDDREYIQWTQNWITACARLLKTTGSMYILIGDEYAAETRMYLKQLERQHKLVFRNWLIWHYTFGQNCRAKFNRSHVHLFYAVGPAAFDKTAFKLPHGENAKVRLPFTFNREAIAVPSARQLIYRDIRANPAGKLPDDTWYLRPQQALEDQNQGAADSRFFEPDGDTWYLSRLCGTFKERQGWHPCQLPEALLERIIKLSSNPADVVFDPFAGSGTTLAVAARLGRRYIGCELSAQYALKATQRIEHSRDTGSVMTTDYADKGIVKGRPRKKAERKKSEGLF